MKANRPDIAARPKLKSVSPPLDITTDDSRISQEKTMRDFVGRELFNSDCSVAFNPITTLGSSLADH